MDVYAGFGGEAGGLGYDLGVITYQYPVTPEFNFTEVYVSGTMSIVTVGLAYTVDAASGNDGGVFDSGDMYVNGSLDFAAGKSDVRSMQVLTCLRMTVKLAKLVKLIMSTTAQVSVKMVLLLLLIKNDIDDGGSAIGQRSFYS